MPGGIVTPSNRKAHPRAATGCECISFWQRRPVWQFHTRWAVPRRIELDFLSAPDCNLRTTEGCLNRRWIVEEPDIGLVGELPVAALTSDLNEDSCIDHPRYKPIRRRDGEAGQLANLGY